MLKLAKAEKEDVQVSRERMRSMYVHEINLSRTPFLVLFSVPVLGVLELKEKCGKGSVWQSRQSKKTVPDEEREALPVRTTFLSSACNRFLCR